MPRCYGLPALPSSQLVYTVPVMPRHAYVNGLILVYTVPVNGLAMTRARRAMPRCYGLPALPSSQLVYTVPVIVPYVGTWEAYRPRFASNSRRTALTSSST
jgi:hypothetical protein